MSTDAKREFDVVITGGGPAGLVLANELGRRGVACILFDEKPFTTTDPRAHAAAILGQASGH